MAVETMHMIEKKLTLYRDNFLTETRSDDILFLEISRNELVFLVKNETTIQLEAFELYAIESNTNSWFDIFFHLETDSEILNRHFKEVKVYFNFSEALLIPEEKFSISAAEDFLTMIYGDMDNEEMKYELISPKKGIYQVYRLPKDVHHWLVKQFILYQPHHIYANILHKVLNKEPEVGLYMKVECFDKQFIVVLLINGKLQLIQSFAYLVQEDLLYQVMNILQQFAEANTTSHLEISGMINTDSEIFENLTKLFTETSLENIGQGASIFNNSDHPLHYFTPFYKLTI